MGNEVSLINEGTPIENDINVTWKQAKPDCPFPAREGQSYCTIGNKLYIFGGVIQCKDDEVETINELICFDCDNEKWTQCEAKGTPPSPSSGSTMSCVGNKLYVFGGLNQETGWSSNLHVYDTESSTWSLLEVVGSGPSPRDKLASVTVGKCIYYFGGFGPKVHKEGEEEEADEPGSDEEEVSSDEDAGLRQQGVEFKWFDDFYIFNTENNTWSQPMHMNLALPSARAAMTMCAHGRDIIIFGGRDCEKRKNDVHIYNIDTRKWKKLDDLSGRLPGCRSYHSATILGNRMIVMGGRSDSESHFGDVHVLDLSTGQWLQPHVTGYLPSARGQHSVGVCGDHLVLHGGSAQFDATTMQCKEYLTDTYLAKTESLLKGSSITPETKEKDTA